MNTEKLDLLKSHVAAYTRADGAVVNAHDDKRTAAQPVSAGYKVTHNVSGSGLKEGGVVPVKAKPEAVEKKLGMKPGSLAPSGSDGHYSESHRVTHAGGTQHSIYSAGGEVRVRAYNHADGDATKALVDHLGSDSGESDLGPHKAGDTVSYKGERGATRTGKVKGSRDGKVVVEHKAGYTELKHHSELSAKYEAHSKNVAAPADGEVGSEERQKYGKYFKKGDKVKDGAGKPHVVVSHTGPVVTTESGKVFHPTKLDRA